MIKHALMYGLMATTLYVSVFFPATYLTTKLHSATKEGKEFGQFLAILVSFAVVPMVYFVTDFMMRYHGCDMGIECLLKFLMAAPISFVLCAYLSWHWFKVCWAWKEEGKI